MSGGYVQDSRTVSGLVSSVGPCRIQVLALGELQLSAPLRWLRRLWVGGAAGAAGAGPPEKPPGRGKGGPGARGEGKGWRDGGTEGWRGG